MKFTKSKDGKLRGTLAIKFRIGREQIINVCCSQIANDIDYHSQINFSWKTRKAVLDEMRQFYLFYGPDKAEQWTEIWSGEEMNKKIRQVVEENITKLFPELIPA